jgi:hypothetical protein
MKPNHELVALLAIVVDRPMTYPEIESQIPRRTNPYMLGLTLTWMVNNKRLHYKAPPTYSAQWPLYSNRPVKGRACPYRRETE